MVVGNGQEYTMEKKSKSMRQRKFFFVFLLLYFTHIFFATNTLEQHPSPELSIEQEPFLQLNQEQDRSLEKEYLLDPEPNPKSKLNQQRFPQLTLEIPNHALVQKYLDQYTSNHGLNFLSTVMQRSIPYRDFILEEINRQEAPEWLLYLPVIESSFSVTAISKSGATGIWQFMKNSIGGYNIRINEWMDERRDPWLSSVAAIKKLKENYNDLGDWYLALAAYNCGLGATRIAIKKGGKADFWYLAEKGYFKSETVHYVPKFLAVSQILSKSDSYGIDWGETTSQPELTTIPVKKAIDLTILAKEAQIDAQLLKQANPALFYYITPPETLYALRVPLNSEETIKAVLNDPNKKFLEYYIYKIKSGDTLFALALHYGIPLSMILDYNPGVKAQSLQIGKTLMIPAFKQVSTYVGKKDPENLNFSGTYLVKKGDSLWSIALAYGVQVETLAEKNGIHVNDVLSLGKQLQVPILN